MPPPTPSASTNLALLPAGTPPATPVPAARAQARRGLLDESPPSRRAEFVGLAIVFAQVALVALVMRAVGIESLALRRVVYIALFGFVVHHLLPARFRLPFFAALSIGSMVVLLGGTIDSRVPDFLLGAKRTAALLAIGAILIGICHLRISFWARAALLAAAAAGCAVFRAGLRDSGDLAIVWPVLAALFMFRVAVYLYDVSTSPARPTRSQSLSYFFLFPNVCSLLFPVIDFRTFCQKRYDEDALAIYQRGARWMARGVVHLLLYRAVDRLLAIDAQAVSNGTELVQFIVSNLFLYLKVSGGFHLAIGVLLLFGFNLPETNHRYFLAASFTDYWRRVNIYWRNFIMKVVYYPAFFRLKALGQTRALVLATLWSFFVTWALHLYQTWWIKGAVTWSWPDTLFWSALAVLVLVNSLSELKRHRVRKLAASRYSAREAAALALRTAGTFAVIAVLWSLWSTPTLTQWWRIWSLADLHTLAWGAAALVGVMLATLLFEVLPVRTEPRALAAVSPYRTLRFGRDALICAAPLLAVFLATHPRLLARASASGSAQLVDFSGIMQVLLEKNDEARGQGRGYYENLTAQDQGSGQFYETLHPGQGFRYAQPTRPVEGVHFQELIPSLRFAHRDWRFETNRWSMRDRDYPLVKPTDTIRIALLGSSHVMGFGVTESEMFEPALEERFNREHAEHGRFELLNFAVGGLSPPAQIWLLQDRVPRFRPDFVIFVAHPNDFEWTNRDVVRIVRKRLPLPAGLPAEILDRAGVHASMPDLFAHARLQPFEGEMVEACYQEIAARCRTAGACPIYVFLPVPMELPLDKAKTERQLRFARDAGFVVVNLAEVFDGHETASVTLRDNGRHLNARGHTLIANALYHELVSPRGADLLTRTRHLHPVDTISGAPAGQR